MTITKNKIMMEREISVLADISLLKGELLDGLNNTRI